jgi:hypothetical protein
MQIVIFLPTFNAPYMCLKIRCDGWKRKYFEFGWEVNGASVSSNSRVPSREKKIVYSNHPLSHTLLPCKEFS